MYSLLSRDHERLRTIAARFADDGEAYGAALDAVAATGATPVVAQDAPPRALTLEHLLATTPIGDVERAFAGLGPRDRRISRSAGSAGRIERLCSSPRRPASTSAPTRLVNQRAVLDRRADAVQRLFAKPPHAAVIMPAGSPRRSGHPRSDQAVTGRACST